MTQSLKILHILDHSLPLHSSYTFRSQNIFRSQIKSGWQPIVVTSSKHESGLKTDHAPDETEVFYNKARRHQHLGNISPEALEQTQALSA